ncbi:hypothetical protein WJX73_000173 [Symbiochloris irregularis]|uniref:LAGLIDADG homing endonuclease n=1 Tax=Symbiochloris irregularis TaxID=706552 RepID=A0AAW1P160_9CHLO
MVLTSCRANEALLAVVYLLFVTLSIGILLQKGTLDPEKQAKQRFPEPKLFYALGDAYLFKAAGREAAASRKVLEGLSNQKRKPEQLECPVPRPKPELRTGWLQALLYEHSGRFRLGFQPSLVQRVLVRPSHAAMNANKCPTNSTSLQARNSWWPRASDFDIYIQSEENRTVAERWHFLFSFDVGTFRPILCSRELQAAAIQAALAWAEGECLYLTDKAGGDVR